MILNRYIARFLIIFSCIALLALLSVFSFFMLVDQLEDTGVGDYGLVAAVQYVLLTIPRLIYELFPIATVIGSMTALGMLANHQELAVMRTSGVSKKRLAFFLFKISLLFIAVSAIIGELIAPIGEQAAKQKKILARSQQTALKTPNGFWLRDDNHYILIKTILPNYHIQDIYIYELNERLRLTSILHATDGQYRQNKWLLRDINKINMTDDKISMQQYAVFAWEASLKPEMLQWGVVEPQRLSVSYLLRYIDYLDKNQQDNQVYLQAFWAKIINPFIIMAMMLLALCVIQYEAKPIGLGRRVFTGTLIGVIFHLANQISSNMGMVYGLNPFISVSLPTIMVFGFIYYSLTRTH